MARSFANLRDVDPRFDVDRVLPPLVGLNRATPGRRDVSPIDAPIHLAVGTLIAGVVFLAALLPARRASSTDPVKAPREG